MDEYKRLLAEAETTKKKPKFGNKKVVLTAWGEILTPEDCEEYRKFGGEPPGMPFDSIIEARYYAEVLLPCILKGLLQVEMQAYYELIPAFEKSGVKHKATGYLADFKITYLDGRIVCVDTKGLQTDVFRIKRKLFDSRYPDIELRPVVWDKKRGEWMNADEHAKLIAAEKRAKTLLEKRAGKPPAKRRRRA